MEWARGLLGARNSSTAPRWSSTATWPVGSPAPGQASRSCGLGPYTAGAVASIAFGEPVAAVDGNVIRVLARIAAIEGDPSRSEVRARVTSLAGELAIGPDPGALNQALMELGATVCSVRQPQLSRLPGASPLSGSGLWQNLGAAREEEASGQAGPQRDRGGHDAPGLFSSGAET